MKNVYCVFDELTGYMGPVVDTNDRVAIRNFSYMIKNSMRKMQKTIRFISLVSLMKRLVI